MGDERMAEVRRRPPGPHGVAPCDEMGSDDTGCHLGLALSIPRVHTVSVREEEHDELVAVAWENCPRCMIAFELDAAAGCFYLVCPLCGMTKSFA
ncbi:hypothetical protein GCM10025866_33410 [Naasia aerilata]|uniref:Uncharacterized protein n=1 Tax=Naasia aerilata TaxID=1162966 RepID=A0ABM8GH14_9MICO|nr:hypothetical protein GCM10025866_33410 [Naasia aerilata]